MATVSFTGLGSGMDIETLVSGLVSASSGQKTAASQRVTETQAAITTMSGIGSLLSDLKSAVDSLDTASELAGVSGSSANADALSVTATGTAKPGSYNVKVWALAQEQRTYSGTQASSGTALNQTGGLKLSLGGTDYNVSIAATDTLSDVAAKINSTGAKISASVFYDGSAYRLQLRGQETGASNAFTVSETGAANLGFTAVDATRQVAQDASVEIDGFLVASKNNTISGAIDGVSFDVKKTTTDYFNVSVKSDTESMKTSLQGFVDKYNSVVQRIHSVAGFGSTKGTSDALKGDATLRAITSGLSSQILSQAGSGGTLDTLADLGIRLNNDGTLKIDSAKLTKSLTEQPDNFKRVLAGTDSSKGLMDKMGDLLKGYTTSAGGLLQNSRDSMNARIKAYQETVTREQTRLDAMEARLRKTLNAMDTKVSEYKNQLSFATF